MEIFIWNVFIIYKASIPIVEKLEQHLNDIRNMCVPTAPKNRQILYKQNSWKLQLD